MLTILIVEDHLDIRENIIEILEMEGYLVISAVNGETGFDIAKSKLPDIIICDVRMPVMDGHELLRKLKLDNATFNLPFIFITSNSEKGNIQESLGMGAAGYLVKPFETEELLAMIKQVRPENY